MRFELRPNSIDNYNHVLLKKPFLNFKKGEIIWANHDSERAFYCDTNGNCEIFRMKNKKHLDYFYRSAASLVGTIWSPTWTDGIYKGLKLKIKYFRTGGYGYQSNTIKVLRYHNDIRHEVTLNETNMNIIESTYRCINIEEL